MLVQRTTQTHKSVTDNPQPLLESSRSSKGFKGESVITTAEAGSKSQSKKVKVKAEDLPKVAEKHRQIMDNLHKEIVRINGANFFVKCTSLISIAVGASSLRPQFVEVRKSVHFLTFFAEYNADKEKWKLLMTSYRSSALGSALFQRLLEYHAEWNGKMTPGQMLTFCKIAGIDKSKGVHYLNKGDKKSMEKVIEMMEKAKPVTA